MITSLLLAVIAVGVGAGAVAVVDETEGGVPVVAREVVAGTLAVELAEAVADVAAGLVVGHELLGLEAAGAGIAHVNAGRDAGSKELQSVQSQSTCLTWESRQHRRTRTPSTPSVLFPGMCQPKNLCSRSLRKWPDSETLLHLPPVHVPKLRALWPPPLRIETAVIHKVDSTTHCIAARACPQEPR